LASNEEAWQQARDVKGIISTSFPGDDMVWATVSTRDSTSWLRLDGHGMARAVTMISGEIYWVLAVPKRNSAHDDADIGSTGVFVDDWEPHSASQSLWNHEGIFLRQGDVL
jgi:hypothetical protein